MRIVRFVSNDGETLIGEDHADGTANLLLDALGVLEPKHSRQAIREMLRDRCALVADDDVGIRTSVGAILDKLGCNCVSCQDGTEAISTLEAREVDLVVSDIVMPGRDGYDVFAAAKQKDEDLPVILITGFGYDPAHQIVRATEEGLEGVLFKPFTPQQLVDRIMEVVRPAMACGNGAFVRLPERKKIQRLLAPVQPRDLVGISRRQPAGAHTNGHSDDGRLFVRPSATVQHPGMNISLPEITGSTSRALGCVAAVIGKRLRQATEAEAHAGVLGYTLTTDVISTSPDDGATAWAGGRGFDASCPLGPAIVTPDELAETPVEITTRINGTLASRDTVSNVTSLAARTLSRISERLTLEPGSIVMLRQEPPDGPDSLPGLSTGDVVRVDATVIGALENPVA